MDSVNVVEGGKPRSLRQHIDEEFERRAELVTQAYDKYHSYLLSYLISLTKNYHEAEDILMGMWRVVLVKFDEDKIGKLGILRNKAFQEFADHYRKKKNRPETFAEEITELEGGILTQPLTDDEEAKAEDGFWSEFPDIDLTEQQKKCLWLKSRYGYTYGEIQGLTGIPKSTVGDYVNLARNRLKIEFQNQS